MTLADLYQQAVAKRPHYGIIAYPSDLSEAEHDVQMVYFEMVRRRTAVERGIEPPTAKTLLLLEFPLGDLSETSRERISDLLAAGTQYNMVVMLLHEGE